MPTYTATDSLDNGLSELLKQKTKLERLLGVLEDMGSVADPEGSVYILSYSLDNGLSLLNKEKEKLLERINGY